MSGNGSGTMLQVPLDPVQLARDLAERNIGDGLPVVPATPERVDAMLGGASRDPDEVMGYMEPGLGRVTPRDIAINGVLAGCAPEHMPVLLAIADALLDREFNLFAIQPTTNPVTPLVIVHGPVATQLGMNAGAGCFGPGNYANAVIGRAVRFMLQNLGGGIAGVTDHATQGWPGKYTFCAAENTEETPWKPFHVQRGLEPGDSAITIFGISSQHSIIDITAKDGYEVLRMVGKGMAAVGTNNLTMGGEALVVLSPEQAAQVADTGLDEETAARVLFEHARIDMTDMPESFKELIDLRRPSWYDENRLPIVDRWEDIQLVVAGGPGIWASYMPSFGTTRAVTRKVDI